MIAMYSFMYSALFGLGRGSVIDAVSRCGVRAEGEGLEPPSGYPRRISSAVPYQLGLALLKKEVGPLFHALSGRQDLNLRPLRPERSALPG